MKLSKANSSVRDDYFDLILKFPLVAIRSETELDGALGVLLALEAKATGAGLSEGERKYVDALAALVGVYEAKQYPATRKSTPLERLKGMMESAGLNISGLGKILGSQSVASQILSGKREMSKAHIRAIAAHFHINPGLLL